MTPRPDRHMERVIADAIERTLPPRSLRDVLAQIERDALAALEAIEKQKPLDLGR